MRLTIEINMELAGFKANPDYEIGLALGRTAAAVRRALPHCHGSCVGVEGVVDDTDGVPVGQWKVTT